MYTPILLSVDGNATELSHQVAPIDGGYFGEDYYRVVDWKEFCKDAATFCDRAAVAVVAASVAVVVGCIVWNSIIGMFPGMT